MKLDKVQTGLNEVIEKDIERLKSCQNEDERKKTIAELESLHQMRIEEFKIEADLISKEKQREDEQKARYAEIALKQDQLKSQATDRWVNAGIQAGIAIGGWLMYSIWQGREQKFELVGTPSTPMFRSLLGKMIPSLKK